MRTIFFVACLEMATTLRSTPATAHGVAFSRAQRPSKLIAQQLAPGWISGIDPESGQTYFYHEPTGISQWEPPPQTDQQVYTGQVMWQFSPAWGLYSDYTVRSGEEQVLGRFDMVEQKNTVSRMQCVVQVAADGTASVVSLGKRPTGLRARAGPDKYGRGAPWYGLESDATRMNAHVLKDGEQIALDMDSGESLGYQGTPYSAVFTCHMVQGDQCGQQDQYGQPQGQYGQQGGYAEQQGGYMIEHQGGYGGYQ